MREAGWRGRNLDVTLNRLAQGLDGIDDALDSFAALPDDKRRNVLLHLRELIVQSHPDPDDVAAAVRHSAIGPTHTPAVLIVSGDHLPSQLSKIAALPTDEQTKSFRLLIALLGVADGRRRATWCVDGCSHWWHHIT